MIKQSVFHWLHGETFKRADILTARASDAREIVRPLVDMIIFMTVALGASSPALAHDFWLEAEPYRTSVNERLGISAHIGMDMQGERQIWLPDLFDDLSVIDTQGRRELTGEIGDDPVTTLQFDAAGTYVVGAHAQRRRGKFGPEKFTRYLQAEGLDWVVEQRESRGRSKTAAREYYSRYVKALIRIDAPETASRKPSATSLTQRFGYRLEMTPLNNPYDATTGDTLEVILEYQGKPIADLLVIAFTKQQPERLQKQRSGADGKARITLDRTGTWLVKAVHIIPSDEADAEWESFWSSLSFELTDQQ